MPMLDLGDTSLYYEDTGPGSTGETIVWSHGLLWSTVLFAPQIAALRERYRCIAWDHRGQGQSASDDRHHIGIELVTGDAIRLIEKLAPGPVHFAGLSMGGFVGMRIAARRPDLVTSLILLETSSEPEPVENVPRYRLLSKISRVIPLSWLASRIGPIMLGASFRSDPARKAEVKSAVQTMTARKDIWRAVAGVVDRPGVTHELAHITCPTLVVVGEEDTATVPAKAELIASHIAGAKLVRIPKAGHSSSIEEPAAVTAAIADFLATGARSPAA
jgi:pimeloyl-ACP methyl ester carboxylesterase